MYSYLMVDSAAGRHLFGLEDFVSAPRATSRVHADHEAACLPAARGRGGVPRPGHGARPAAAAACAAPGTLGVLGGPMAGRAEGVAVPPDHGAHAVQLGAAVPAVEARPVEPDALPGHDLLGIEDGAAAPRAAPLSRGRPD